MFKYLTILFIISLVQSTPTPCSIFMAYEYKYNQTTANNKSFNFNIIPCVDGSLLKPNITITSNKNGHIYNFDKGFQSIQKLNIEPAIDIINSYKFNYDSEISGVSDALTIIYYCLKTVTIADKNHLSNEVLSQVHPIHDLYFDKISFYTFTTNIKIVCNSTEFIEDKHVPMPINHKNNTDITNHKLSNILFFIGMIFLAVFVVLSSYFILGTIYNYITREDDSVTIIDCIPHISRFIALKHKGNPLHNPINGPQYQTI